METLLPRETALERFCNTFLGFGDPQAPWWFVSYGSHHARLSPHYMYGSAVDDDEQREVHDRETLALIDLWYQCGGAQGLDLDMYRERLMSPLLPLYHGSKLDRIARLCSVLDKRSQSFDELQETADALGTTRFPRAFLAELNPISREAFYRIRAHFAPTPWRAHGFQRTARAFLLRHKIDEFRPQLVVMYGWTGIRYWNRISGLDMSRMRAKSRLYDISIEKRDSTIFAAIAAPSTFWFPEKSFRSLVRNIDARLQSEP